MENIYTVEEIKALVTPVAERYGVDDVYLFGSYARGEATGESDIDLRITRGGMDISNWKFGGFLVALDEALQKDVDVVTTESLYQDANDKNTKRLLKRISGEEILLYDRKRA